MGCVAQGQGHEVGQSGLDLGQRAARAGHGDKPGPSPQRAESAHLRRAGESLAAADDEHVPGLALVQVRRRGAQKVIEVVGQAPLVRRGRLHRRSRNAYAAHLQPAHEGRGVQQGATQFGRVQGHGRVRAHGRGVRQAGCAV